jgi:hypothetical protein
MKSGHMFQASLCGVVSLVLLCCAPAVYAELDAEDAGGLQQNYVEKADVWEEQDVTLPAYPEKKNLMDLGIGTDAMQYTVYLDKPSLVRGEDGVVRYTVVLVPSSGIWNVSNEGLRCGEKLFRRYAYGIDGDWHPMNNSPWRDVLGSGANRYRRILYDRYFCNPMRPNRTVEEMINSFTETWHEEM